ncbi:efflux RND transporter periplasmic adaptor subunit [Magnetococcus sp. PR-3]|uniref:efflux RND transporter periplasmic adaptor subunit n=1 Tax=Magnetococcus sp. PR-3 TaxID=3120355 RepID=UPI002FCDEDE1
MNCSVQQVAPSEVEVAEGHGASLSDLLTFEGAVEQFWPAYLAGANTALMARKVMLLIRSEVQPWQGVLTSPQRATFEEYDAADLSQLADQALERALPMPGGEDQPILALPLAASPDGERPHAVLICWLSQPFVFDASSQALTSLVMTLPAHFMTQYSQRMAMPRDAGAERLFEILQLSASLSRQPRFMRTAFDLCSELAVRFECARVSLGWVDGDYVKLVAVSHIEKFDTKTQAAKEMASAMEEALDQSCVVSFPARDGDRVVNRAHETYVKRFGEGSASSIPIHWGEQTIAVLLVEKGLEPLTTTAVWELELTTQACAYQLQQVRASDRWFGARFWHSFRQGVRALFGPEQAMWKLVAVLFSCTLFGLIVTPWNYQVDVGAQLRSQDLLFMPAPFDGFLHKVHVDVGDRVGQGEVLATLDTRDLKQEAAMATSEIVRYKREVEKANASRKLAEMQIALARLQQSEARLALVQYRLDHAHLSAPYDGMIVEGDLKTRLGAPVRRGDLLLKLARTENIYLELEVSQADVHELKRGQMGEVSLVGRPDQRFEMSIERIDPMATQRENRSVFLARGQIVGEAQEWWRPGMGGNAKVSIEDRPLIWVLSHRTVNFLRELFWL